MQKRGFTLIELLVVVIIIAILSTVATTSFLNAQRNARDDSRKAAVSAIATAVEAYKLVENHYPGLATPVNAGSCTVDSTYYYHPALGCQFGSADVSTVTGQADGSKAFAPTPNWIPGLGKYLNPPASEIRYVASNGSETDAGSFVAATGQPSASTRTYSYKRTTSGYYVWTKLEQGAGTFSISK